VTSAIEDIVGSFAEWPESATTLTLSEAARICAIPRGRVRRSLDRGEFGGAFKGDDGAWRVPIADLVAAGFEPLRPEAIVRRREEPRAEVEVLRSENALLRELLADVVAVARERGEHIQELRYALRMLPEAWARKLSERPRPRAEPESIWRESKQSAPPQDALGLANRVWGMGGSETANQSVAWRKESVEEDPVEQFRERWWRRVWPARSAGRHRAPARG
jgi:hypothetical protein